MKYIIRCHIKNLRKDRDLTQEELAEKLGISRQALIALEQGRSLPSLNLAFEMANLFEKSIEEMFCDIENQLNKDQSKYQLTMPIMGRKENKMDRDLIPFGNIGVRRFFDEDTDEDLLPMRFRQNVVQMPRVDVYEKGNDVIVEALLPGMKAEDVEIEVSDEYVTLIGERKLEQEDKDKNYYRKEVSYGSFKRVVGLPVKVKSEKASAEAKDGVLKITLPKAEEKKLKKLKVKVSK